MYTGLGGPEGYGEGVFSSSVSGGVDDGSVAVDVTSVFGAGGLDFFGTNYNQIFVNANGTISFGSPLSSFDTTDLAAETTPMLAPFFADVNLSNGGEIYWDLDPAAGKVTITWHDVAPYSGSGANSFQVQLTSLGNGDFSIEYVYEDIQWTGSGGDVADIGLTDGGSNDEVFSESGNATSIAGLPNANIQAGDPAGTYLVTMVDGVLGNPNGTVEGTSGDDVIDTSYIDPDGESVSGQDDIVVAGAGNDTITTGAGADTITGGFGDDVIDAGAGNDVINGGGGEPVPQNTTLDLNWIDGGTTDGTDLAGGFTQDAGGVNVAVSYSDDGNGTAFTASTANQYVAAGESFSQNSSVRLQGDGTSGDTSTVTLNFSATGSSVYQDEVADVTFRINDIDQSTWDDEVIVRAFDADGNPVDVTINFNGTTTTGTAPTVEGSQSTSATDANGSALITIPGPVSRVEIDYNQLGSAGQLVWVSDVQFLALVDGNKVSGNDTLTGGDGDDTFIYDGGDDVITDLNVGNSGGINDGDASNNDTVDLGAYYDHIRELRADFEDDGILNQSNTTDTEGNAVDYSNNTQFGDGSLTIQGVTSADLTVENTNVVCFTPGTLILTAKGQCRVEGLRVGDMVVTADNGLQPIMWISDRVLSGAQLMADPRLAPVRIERDVFGNDRPLIVSPQHAMVMGDGSGQSFVRAKHLALETAVARHILPEPGVRYIHMMFERHEVIFAEGAPTESFYPGEWALNGLTNISRAELQAMFPGQNLSDVIGPKARPVLRRREVRGLFGLRAGSKEVFATL